MVGGRGIESHLSNGWIPEGAVTKLFTSVGDSIAKANVTISPQERKESTSNDSHPLVFLRHALLIVCWCLGLIDLLFYSL